ncbi:MAG TPA: carboxypeptidase-like regulatory domain-containing protein [Candidatus Sulfotelmatobacter sp.]|nr:carboxypeptidase-like regulatory domain-containing protein [Candidatus Sulfotelmatobacter sp.]
MKILVRSLLLVLLLFLTTASITFAQTVQVTGSIVPKLSDFQLQFMTPTIKNPVVNGDSITYQISYGSHLYYPTPLTLQATWDDGNIQGDTTPYAIAEYVPNSASTTNGTTPAIVDMINKKITWPITSFPAQTTDKTAVFQLRMNNAYTGSDIVTFNTHATLFADTLSLPEIAISKQYSYSGTNERQTPIITATPTTNNLTQNPQNTLQFTNITLRSLTASNIKLLVQTSQHVQIKISYGKTSSDLGIAFDANTLSTDHEILIDKLAANTIYFLRFIAKNQANQTIVSDIYSFKTALPSQIPAITDKSVIITSGNSILADPYLLLNNSTKTPLVVIPTQQAFEFKFALDKSTKIRNVSIVIRNKQVLGMSTNSITESSESNDATTAIELMPGNFIGRITSPILPGSYEIFARITDTVGNIVEQKIAELHVTEKFRVLDNQKHTPIEGAQVLLYYFNLRQNIYQILPSAIFPIKNPSYTNRDGQMSEPLPQGKYLAKVRAIGYGQQEIKFTIGQSANQVYPTVYLNEEPFNIVTPINYYWTTMKDVADQSKIYIMGLANSSHFFEFNALLVIMILVLLTLLSLSSRIHIPLHSLLEYSIHRGKILAIKRALGEKIKGRVFDENTSEVLSDADIYLIDDTKNKILAHTKTNAQGDFIFIKIPNKGYEIEVMKEGYEPITYKESDIQAIELGGYLLSIKKNQFKPTFLTKINVFLHKLLSLLFESLLIASLVSEISLGYALGWEKVGVFLIFSLTNLSLWVLHMSHLRSEKNIF